MYPSDENYYQESPALVKRILKNKKFFDGFNKVLNDYISDPKNFEDDLIYYDGLYKKYKADFYKDQAKIDNDFIFNQKVKGYREIMIANFEMAKELAQLNSFPVSVKARHAQRSTAFESSFKYFDDIFLSRDAFLARNPQFLKLGDSIVGLAGSQTFPRTVIVPRSLRLVIEPGARLFFGPGVSLISYSPVTALGNFGSPINFGPLIPGGEPWGSFGVVGVERAKSYFNFVNASGGSEDKINGVPFLSQFSLRNADAEITNSVFEKGRSDDAFHVIRGSANISHSIFRNTSSDGIDFDYVSNSKIILSFFMNDLPENSNGDGIDLSGTENIEISDNKIVGFGDKCISVGENSHAVIKNNILVSCNFGIAVKDNSNPVLEGNTIVGNNTGLALYRKKQEFVNGGKPVVLNSIIWGNDKEIEQDEFSLLQIKDSTVKGGYSRGENINTSKPNFNKILPAFILRLVGQKL